MLAPHRFRWPLLAALFLAGCQSIPEGPSMMVLPGTGKSFDQFRFDDADCRQYAQAQVGGASAEGGAAGSMAKSAAVGAAVGAAAGALMGGHEGAGSGAGTGLVVGTMAGAGAGQGSAHEIQRRYDAAYGQCMYAKGHRVPTQGGTLIEQGPARAPANVPPPPAGYPPPPPPGAPR